MKRREKRSMKPNKKQDKKMIYTIAAIFMLLFGLLIGYLIYFNLFKQKEMSTHAQNLRMSSLESEVIRGNIYDGSEEQVLLATTDENGMRVYPFDNLYAHVVGYCQNGKTGCEALANSELLYPSYSLASIFKMAFFNEKFHGRDVVLTVDHRYQEAIASGLKGKRGAAVVMEASTGKVLAMYSNPNFNPNEIVENWQVLNTDEEDRPLINRATIGLYPPGSIFKVVTALAYMNEQKALGEEGNELAALDFTYDCPGYMTGHQNGKDYRIACFNGTAHGKVDLKSAFAKSCNGYFIALSRTLPEGALKQAAESLYFNRAIPTDIGYKISRFNLAETDPAFEHDATAIGQGKTLTNPFEMAWVASAIANDGMAMKPYLIKYSMNQHGKAKENMPSETGALMSEEKAKSMQLLMEEVLDHGTAVSLPEKGLVVGGKTGTAENETEADHSWFMGYAKDPEHLEKPTIAFAVIVEGGGKGAQALGVSDKILQAYREIN